MARKHELAGCRQLRRCRSTGTIVGVYRAEEAHLAGGPWVTLCEDHGSCCSHDTLALARYHASEPINWCEECRQGVERKHRQQELLKLLDECDD